MHVAPRKLFENVIVVQYIGLVGVTLLTLFGFQAAFGNVLTGANLEVLAMNMVFEGIMALGMTFVIIMGELISRWRRSSRSRRSWSPNSWCKPASPSFRPFWSRFSPPPPLGP